MEIEVEGEIEEEVECPHCKKKFNTIVHYHDVADVDMSDYKDGSWRD